jgi:cytochrome c1
MRVGCGACHAIPGIQGADGIVGPSLDTFARRSLIGGVVANRPGQLVRWVREAPALAPDTGMPAMPITENEARDIAAYLYTLR